MWGSGCSYDLKEEEVNDSVSEESSSESGPPSPKRQRTDSKLEEDNYGLPASEQEQIPNLLSQTRNSVWNSDTLLPQQTPGSPEFDVNPDLEFNPDFYSELDLSQFDGVPSVKPDAGEGEFNLSDFEFEPDDVNFSPEIK